MKEREIIGLPASAYKELISGISDGNNDYRDKLWEYLADNDDLLKQTRAIEIIKIANLFLEVYAENLEQKGAISPSPVIAGDVQKFVREKVGSGIIHSLPEIEEYAFSDSKDYKYYMSALLVTLKRLGVIDYSQYDLLRFKYTKGKSWEELSEKYGKSVDSLKQEYSKIIKVIEGYEAVSV